MRPDEYEQVVAENFKSRGYEIETTQQSNDYGIDVFATKEGSKIAIQVKMYGDTSRRINRQMIMELHGAKDYFSCTKAIMVTNGKIIPNALEVAKKLKIDILEIPAEKTTLKIKQTENFESIWEKYILPLKGEVITRENGKTNKILEVDWSGVKRITSNGREQKINIEIFKKTINHLLKHGTITRKYINDEYLGRASSGIVLILSHTDKFELTNKPTGLTINKIKVVNKT